MSSNIFCECQLALTREERLLRTIYGESIDRTEMEIVIETPEYTIYECPYCKSQIKLLQGVITR